MQDGKFFEMLTENVEFLRTDSRYTTDAILESGIMETIRLETGLKVNFNIQKSDSNNYGAYVILPNVDKNHPFIESYIRKYFTSTEGINAINYKNAIPKGTVSTETGKVSGWFSEIRHEMVISQGLFISKTMKSEEIAAIILHELGHLFTYYLHLGTTVVSNLMLGATARRIVNAKDYTERTYVLEEAERTLGIEIPDKEMLAKIETDKNANGIQTVMLTSLAEKARYETGFNIYELRACEQIADQFAVKHGAGVHLASALSKIYDYYGHSSYRNRMLHVFMEIMKLIFWCFVFLFTLIVPVVCFLLVGNPWRKTYDDPAQRLEFIASTLKEEIKERKLPEERRKQLVDDIEKIKMIAEEATDKRTLNQLFWQYLTFPGNKAAKQENIANKIIELSNNDLFISANKFALVSENMEK